MISSLVIAIVMWSFVNYSNDIEIKRTFHFIDVTYTGEDILKANGYIVKKHTPIEDLSVRIAGSRAELADALDRVKIEVDVSGINGVGEYELEGTVKLPNQRIYVDKKKFSTVTVEIEEYAEKEIPIQVRQIGSFKSNPVCSEPEVSTIKIGGAKSGVEKVESGYVTVDLARLAEPVTTVSGVVLTDSEGNAITEEENVRSLKQSIKIKNIRCEYAELRVEPVLDGTLGGYTLDREATVTAPETVSVGIMPGYSFDSVSAVIKEYTTDTIVCELAEEEGMYLPAGSRTVEIKPAFEDDGNSEE